MRIVRGLALAFVVASAAGATVAAAGTVAAPDQADAVELRFDDAGVLHLVAHVTANGLPNELIHREQAPGGSWSEPEQLATGFAIAGPKMELVRRPDGALCLFFDGWRDPRDTGTVGLYLRCREGRSWSAAVQVGAAVGVTATFDGAFAADGTARGLYSRPTRTIGFGGVELWHGDRDAGWPELAIDADGTLHAAWAAFTDPFGIFTSRSRDGGQTWTEPESLTGDAAADVPYDFVADRAGAIHLLVPGTPSMYRRWSGGAWSPVVELPTDIGPKRLTVGADGLASVAWASQESVFVLRQGSDGSWTAPAIVDAPATPPSRVAIAVAGSGEVAVVWADANGLSVSGAAATGFSDSVPSPFDITLDPVILAQSAVLAAGVVLLIPLPAQLFNHTVEANYARISGAFARVRRRFGGGRTRDFGAFWRRPIGMLAFFGLAALISAFLDPSLAFSAASLATIAGLFLGLVIVALAFALPSVVLHRIRSRGSARVEVLPLALPVAVLSVAISRLTSFEPGYLYGLLAGVTLVGAARPGDTARGIALSSVWVLVLVLVAWFGLVPVREIAGGADPALWAIAAEAGLATIVVSGLEGLLFGLLPLDVTPGGVLFKANRRAWAVLLAVAAFAFFHVLVNPSSGYLVDSSRVPLVTTVALFVGFSALTAATWAYFRFRPTRLTDAPTAPSG